LTARHSGSVTGATNASPIVVTSAGHGLADGTRVTVSGVLGNTAANGTLTVTAVAEDTISLDGSAGGGAYASGGSWHVTGLYAAALDCTAANGYAAGQTYQVLVSYAVDSDPFAGL